MLPEQIVADAPSPVLGLRGDPERAVVVSQGAGDIDGGELYGQLKAPTQVRDISTGEVRYHWSESGSMDYYRHAHAYDHLVSSHYSVPFVIVV